MQACMFELVVVWNCRSEHRNAYRVGFFSNRVLIAAVFVSGLLTVSLFYVTMFQLLFNTVPLMRTDWIWIAGTSLLGFAVIPAVFITQGKNTEINNFET